MKNFFLTAAFVCAAGGAYAAPSTFQQTCSNIEFAYLGSDAGVAATCLTAAGAPNQTSIIVPGISNENGTLTQSGGASSFQKSCGNIDIQITGTAGVFLTALCRDGNGNSQSTSIEIEGLGNNDGNLAF